MTEASEASEASAESEGSKEAWRPFGAGGISAERMLVVAALLAAVGLGLAFLSMILYFTLDTGGFGAGSSGTAKTINAFDRVISPLMLASIVSAVVALVLSMRDRQ